MKRALHLPRALLNAAWIATLVLTGATATGEVPLRSSAPTTAAVVESAPTEPLDLSRDDSRRHFESGIKLYEDRNYSGALAEFEASVAAYPSASALQNVALCQKQLYRYSEARETLKKLISQQAQELTASEIVTVENTISELAQLVGSVRLVVTPKNATVSLDGRTLLPHELERPITLDVGEHRVTAECDGFAPLSFSFRVAGGSANVVLPLLLFETTGQVEIIAPNAQTAIAIDGHPVAFSSYIGRVTPGPHFVQVYRDGYEPYEAELNVKAGDRLRILGVLGEPTETVVAEGFTQSPEPSRRSFYGWYGLASASLLAVRGQPKYFATSANYDPGYELGARAGYRLMTPLGVEAQIASGTHVVKGQCSGDSTNRCDTGTDYTYRLDTRRIGFGVRFLSQGDLLRLYSVISGGIVAQDLRIFGQRASGSNPYVGLELGVSRNFGHVLLDLAFLGTFDGAANVTSRSEKAYERKGGIQMLGIGLRFGWSDWTTPRKVPPPPKTLTKTPTVMNGPPMPPLR